MHSFIALQIWKSCMTSPDTLVVFKAYRKALRHGMDNTVQACGKVKGHGSLPYDIPIPNSNCSLKYELGKQGCSMLVYCRFIEYCSMVPKSVFLYWSV